MARQSARAMAPGRRRMPGLTARLASPLRGGRTRPEAEPGGGRGDRTPRAGQGCSVSEAEHSRGRPRSDPATPTPAPPRKGEGKCRRLPSHSPPHARVQRRGADPGDDLGEVRDVPDGEVAPLAGLERADLIRAPERLR